MAAGGGALRPVRRRAGVLAAHRLEGVIAKRIDSRWEPGDDARPEAFFLRDRAGRPVGQVAIGLSTEHRDSLRAAASELAGAPRAGRGLDPSARACS